MNLQEGHYSLKLPFKTKEMTMPNNRCVAQQHLTRIRKKMERNEEHTEFFEDVINSGSTEMVPQDELCCDGDNVFYIPHRGVYHPCKGKLRVVFDCGTIQGPP